MTNNYYKVNGEFFFFDSRDVESEKEAFINAALSNGRVSVWKKTKRDVPVVGVAPKSAPGDALDWAEEPS